MSETHIDNEEEDPGFPPTDLTLILEGRKIHVNKAVLMAHSPVFEAMFTSDFKEKDASEVQLKDKSVADFKEFLRCFYPNMQHPITKMNVLKILPMAIEFQSPIKDECERFMSDLCSKSISQSGKMNVQDLLDYIIAAEKFELKTLLEKCIELGAYVDFDKLRGTEHYARKFYSVKNDENVLLKYKAISIETRYLIAENRLKFLEAAMRQSHKAEYASYNKL